MRPDQNSKGTQRVSHDVIGVTFLATAFVVAVWSRLFLPLGRSHDGFNTAVWMDGGRAMVESGVVGSRLGARTAFGTYAHHPPGLYLISALVYALGGTRTVYARVPAVVSVLAGIALAWVLLRTLGRSRLACFGAIAFAVTAPMLLLWGPMLNHEAVAMPWALAALVIGARVQRSQRVPVWLAAFVGFVGAILSWQGLLLVMFLAASSFAPAWRPTDSQARRAMRVLGAAGLVALALTVAWQLWAYGGLRDVIDAFRFRVNGATQTKYGFVESQVRYAYQGFPIWTLLLAAYGTCLLWRDRASAVTSSALLAAVGTYTFGFRNGATIHVYWNYWLVLIVIVAVAAVIDRHARSSTRERAVVVAALAAMVVAFSTVIATKGAAGIEIGAQAGAVVAQTPIAASQQQYYAFADIDEPPPWISYPTRRPVVIIRDPAEVTRLGLEVPDAVVLIQRSVLDAQRAGGFDALAPAAIVRRDAYESARMADLAALWH